MPASQFFTRSWGSIYRRAFLEDKNVRFEPELRKHEDRPFILRAVTRAETICNIAMPTRVWRVRGNSTTTSIHDRDRIRLSLLSMTTCAETMRAQVERHGLPNIFLERERVHVLKRSIFNRSLMTAIAQQDQAEQERSVKEIAAALGAEPLSEQLLDDAFANTLIDETPLATDKSQRWQEASEIIAAVQSGDLAKAVALGRKPPQESAPRRRSDGRGKARHRTLFLHLGAPKCGSTYLQWQMRHHRQAMSEAGVLFPKTGFRDDCDPVRPGGQQGHQGILNAILLGDDRTLAALRDEAVQVGCQDIVISCENMLQLLDSAKRAAIARGIAEVLNVETVRPVAMLRRPDVMIQSYFMELVFNGNPVTRNSVEEFLANFSHQLTNMPGIFAPFEKNCGTRVAFSDFDACVASGSLWQAFQDVIGLQDRLPAADVPRHPSLGRTLCETARIVNVMLDDRRKRRRVLRELVRASSLEQGDDMSLFSPQQRRTLVDLFECNSGVHTGARGYAPDYTAMRADLDNEEWTPLRAIDLGLVDSLLNARLRCEDPDQG